MKSDFDFIKEKFDNDNINIPSALDEDIIKNSLEGKQQKKLKLYEKRSFKSIVTAAACLAIIAVSAVSIKPYFTQKIDAPQNTSVTAQVSTLKTFSSYAEIKKYIKDNDLASSGFQYYAKGEALETVDTASDSVSAKPDLSFGETYRQVDNVDEGDILKNDGKYIYFVSQGSNIIKIFEGTKVVSEIKIGTDIDWANDIYVKDNMLVVNYVENIYKANTYYKVNTVTDIYDLTDIKKPVRVHHFSQSGSYSSSRMIGDVLYIISNYGIESNMIKYGYVPELCQDNAKSYIDANCVHCPERPSGGSYLVISAINVKTGKRACESKAILGVSDTVYCNERNMYISLYNNGVWKNNEYFPSNKTTIFKVALKENDISFVASCELDGYINNQFSMDEKDGILRVATTTNNHDDKHINELYTFNDKLEPLGKITNIAKGESIKAVRFIGDMAYVITYHEIDPLFVIDLSNPKVPKVKGEVKISGFSSQLVPVDDNTLLGIGYATSVTPNGESTDGLKLVLFDISNPVKPRVITSKVLKDAYSNAQHNHHAIVVNKEQGYYLIDFGDYDGIHTSKGAITFTIDKNKIKIDINNTFRVKQDTWYEYLNTRATYIDDTIYVVSYEGEIKSFKYQ